MGKGQLTKEGAGGRSLRVPSQIQHRRPERPRRTPHQPFVIERPPLQRLSRPAAVQQQRIVRPQQLLRPMPPERLEHRRHRRPAPVEVLNLALQRLAQFCVHYIPLDPAKSAAVSLVYQRREVNPQRGLAVAVSESLPPLRGKVWMGGDDNPRQRLRLGFSLRSRGRRPLDASV